MYSTCNAFTFLILTHRLLANPAWLQSSIKVDNCSSEQAFLVFDFLLPCSLASASYQVSAVIALFDCLLTHYSMANDEESGNPANDNTKADENSFGSENREHEGTDEPELDENALEEAKDKMRREREARAQALTLELLGDLPHAEVKPPEHVLFVCKLNPVTEGLSI